MCIFRNRKELSQKGPYKVNLKVSLSSLKGLFGFLKKIFGRRKEVKGKGNGE